MDEALQYAIADFESFLSGQKAPALVGHSLITVMKNDVRTISHIVMNWAVRQTEGMLANNIIQARNKVFDIFFYRVVKFEGIYKFFPAFEATLLQFCPPAHQPYLSALFNQFSWEDIRPIGDLKQQPVFALEKRTEVSVQEETFNENIYKNVTHNILSLDNRFTFADDQTSAQMAEHQAKVAGLFKDFVGMVKDKQAKKEIFIANEGDKDALYENKKRFNLEDYLIQSLELAVAFFNDDYLLQSSQMMDLIVDLANTKAFKLDNNARFQSKYNLFASRKIEEYTTANKTNRFLVKDILGQFEKWYPLPLLDQLQVEENRRTRRVILNVLECYGTGIHPTLVAELMNCQEGTPWYYVRNLVYLLGKIVTGDMKARNQVAEMTDKYLGVKNVRPLNFQCISTLGFLGTEVAAEKLISKLAVFRKYEDSQSVEATHKIAQALITFESEKAIEAALEFALKNWNNEYTERFAQANLPSKVLANLTGKIRAEIKKMKMSFSLFGNLEMATNLLKAIGHTRSDEVTAVCGEIVKALPASNSLHVRAANTLVQATAPQVVFSSDKLLNRLAISKNIPEMACYLHETGQSGKLRIKTTDQVECSLEFDQGDALYAGVSAHYIEQENAFYWIFLLEPRDIQQVSYGPKTGGVSTLGGSQIEVSTLQLIHEGLLQKGEVQQIVGTALLPDSRFSQRKVGAYFLQFKGADDPAKCKLVWNALASNPDINTLQQVTRLTKYDLYKVLFYLMKQNMTVIDTDKKAQDSANLGDGLTMLEIYLQRIEKKPVMFNSYKASAEICEEIVKGAVDEVIKFAMGVLQKYYWNAFASRHVFVESNLGICSQVIGLVATYVKSKTPTSKEALLSYINFTFQEQDAGLMPAPVPVPEVTVLQKIENIDLSNDAFDDDVDQLFDDAAVDDMFGALDATLNATGTEIPSFGQDTGLTAAEEAMLMDLYDNIAMAYVKPVKDFIREIQMNQRIKRQTSLEWIEMVEPSINLLHGSAEKMGYLKICKVLAELANILQTQKSVPDQTYLLESAVHAILSCYDQLTQMLPKTFALDLSDADLNSKKEVLIVKFILKQLPEINEKMLNRIILAGLSTFDKFMHSSPDEIAAVTGLSKKHGEDVFMKFYQYRHIYYRHNDDEFRDKFIEMFEVTLNILRELHIEIETLVANEKNETEESKLRKNGLKQDRQRTLWSIFILLCIKEEYDLIENSQQSVFDVRIQRLEEYLNKLASAA